MSKVTQRIRSAFDMGRQYKLCGWTMKEYVNPYRYIKAAAFIKGLSIGYTKKKLVITEFVKHLKVRSQTQKNRDKRERKRLKNLSYNS